MIKHVLCLVSVGHRGAVLKLRPLGTGVPRHLRIQDEPSSSALSSYSVAAVVLVQDFRVVVDVTKRQPDCKEGHQGDLLCFVSDVVDVVDGDDDGLDLDLKEEAPTEEDSVLSIEGVVPDQLTVAHLKKKKMVHLHLKHLNSKAVHLQLPRILVDQPGGHGCLLTVVGGAL